jgi:uncharacterized protein (TIGR02145 family)
MKERSIILILIIIAYTSIITCKKETNFWLTETGSSSIDSTKVTFKGNIVMEGDQDGSEYGICYSLTTTNPTLADSFKSVGQAKELGEYSSTLQLLPPGKYSYCSYLKGKDKIQYGEVKMITVAPYAYIKNIPGKIEPKADTIKIVLSNNLPLTATSNVSWVRLASNTIKAGYLQSIELMVDSNTTQTDRSANVIFTAERINQSISITQKLLIVLPTITTSEVSAITATSASCGGDITFNGGADIQERGVCWSITMNPTIENNKTFEGFATGEYTSLLTGLTENTTYYVRAFASNSKGVAYGQQKVFTTTAITKSEITTVTTSEISYTSATSGGNVTYDGGAAVTDKGVCWNTTGNPTVSDNKLSSGKGSGAFASKLTGLQENTTYYVRAFAINNKGTSYGEQQTFTTKEIIVPVLTTTVVSNISYTTLISGGIITSDGGAAVTARGVCWNTTGNPTIADNKTADGSGTGSYTSNLSSLTDGTIYYVRAYATNSKGTVYGTQQTLTTTAITVPILTTTAVSNISYTSATSGGNITSDGGVAVTARGVCWNTTGNPTIADNKTADGTGTGSYTSSFLSLIDGTTYYVRAYATNSKGTAYGMQQSFSTIFAIKPILNTNSVISITSTTATCGGNIINDGGASILERGVCWSTSPNPSILDNKSIDGNVIGSYTSSLSGLVGNTTYYVKAYATNKMGTNYGNEVSFMTLGPDGTIGSMSDIDGNDYKTVVIGTQVWMAENLKTTKYNDGTAIPYVTVGNAWGALTAPAFCWYNDDAATYKVTYGALYNWYVVNTGKLCPKSWHISSDDEWTTMISYLGGESIAGGKLKEADTNHWTSPNTGADNKSGFTALSAGERTPSGFADIMIGWITFFWTSTEYSTTEAYELNLTYGSGAIFKENSKKQLGASVRCIKD